MKALFGLTLLFTMSSAFAVGWSYQVNVNNSQGKLKKIDASRTTFEAGPYDCEVTPVSVSKNTEYRSVVCSVGTGTVSTGGFCTRKGSKVASVQYAILNLNGPKNHVNVVVSCNF